MSPSAEVQGHTPEEAVLQVGKRLVDITGIELVGNYAVRLIFSHGYESGIYSWDYFQKLIEQHDELWNAYLNDLAKAGASRETMILSNKPFEEKAKPKHKCSH